MRVTLCEPIESARIEGFAALAQLVEQLLRKEKVNSSIPLSGTTITNPIIWEILHSLAVFRYFASNVYVRSRGVQMESVVCGAPFLRIVQSHLISPYW